MAWWEKKKTQAHRGKTEGAIAPPHIEMGAKEATTFNYRTHCMSDAEMALWRRPKPKETPKPSAAPFVFQLVNCKAHYIKPSDVVPQDMLAWPYSQNDQVPMINVYGVTPEGISVCVHVWNFAPYLFINAPDKVTAEQAEKKINALLLENEAKKKAARPPPPRTNSRGNISLAGFFDGSSNSMLDPYTRDLIRQDAAMIRRANSLYGESSSSRQMSEADALRESGFQAKESDSMFHTDDAMTGLDSNPNDGRHLVQSVVEEHYKIADGFLLDARRVFRVNLRTPNLVTQVRAMVKSGLKIRKGVHIRGPTYESSVKFENRFMVDTKCCGSGYVRLDKQAAGGVSHWRLRPARKMESTCGIEIDADWSCFHGISMEEDPALYERPSRFRCFSYDIECISLSGAFPQAALDPISNINFTLYEIDNPGVVIADVGLVLGSVPPEAGRSGNERIFCYESEKEMIDDFGVMKCLLDPDIETHYNGKDFDEPYLYDRAVCLGCTGYLASTRNTKEELYKRADTKSSKQSGDRKSWLTPSEGRVSIDMMQKIKADHKLRSYTLNAVAEHFLGERKDDVSHSIIPILWRGSPEDRLRLYRYCRKDAILPARLMTKLMVMEGTFELCRIQGVQLDQQQEAGATLKTFVRFLRAFREVGYIMPYREDLQKEPYIGATVLKAKKGFYDFPVGTLDFSSLYPTQIVSHNICLTTLVRKHFVDDVAELLGGYSQMEACPNGHHYVKSSVREGVIPKILSESLAARQRVKKLAAAASDPFVKKVYTNRELAIKLFNNSVYGYLGRVSNGQNPYELAESTTGYGRIQLKQTVEHIQRKYTKANGYPGDADIIYGDTDSVFVDFGVRVENKDDKAEVSAKVEQIIKLSTEAGIYCTAFFAKPNSLEFENVYLPLIMFSKKRYVGLFWSNSTKHSYMKERGIASVRRDGCLFLARVMKKCMYHLLERRDPAAAMAEAHAALVRLREGQVGIEDLVLSAQIKDFASYKQLVAAVAVAKKMEARDPGNGPKPGDRVKFIVTVPTSKGQTRLERAEDPLYVLNNDVPIDYEYYINNQMMEPLTSLFAPIFGKEKAAAGLSIKNVARLHIKLVSHDVTPGARARGLDQFFKKRETCIHCGVTPDKGCKNLLCRDCEKDRLTIFTREQRAFSSLSVEYNRLWTQCHDCQGTHFKDVDNSCSASDCPIFYKRIQVKKDFFRKKERIDILGELPTW